MTIVTNRRKCRKIAQAKELSDAEKKDLRTRRTKLRTRIEDLRAVQTALIPDLMKQLEAMDPCEVENEKLLLPSDFSSIERKAMGSAILALARDEKALREGEAYDAIESLKTKIKALSAMWDGKNKHSRGLDANTRSKAAIKTVMEQRDALIASYMASREAIVNLSLDRSDDATSAFPPLTLQDTYRKSTSQRRQIGDSRRTAPSPWMSGGISAGTSTTMRGNDPEESSDAGTGGGSDTEQTDDGAFALYDCASFSQLTHTCS